MLAKAGCVCKEHLGSRTALRVLQTTAASLLRRKDVGKYNKVLSEGSETENVQFRSKLFLTVCKYGILMRETMSAI